MLRILILLLPIIAIVGGAFVGEQMLASGDEASQEMAADAGDAKGDAEGEEEMASPDGGAAALEGDRQVVVLERRLIVPIVTDRETRAFILFELALDVPVELGDVTYASEARLRDAFLRSMLSFAAAGVFREGMPSPAMMDETRRLLRVDARRVLEHDDVEVLLTEAIMRSA
ncbi:MAG: hypothetical protein AAGF76_09625 [Pseudomonadota bacterium]